MGKAQRTEISEDLEEAIGTSQPDFIYKIYCSISKYCLRIVLLCEQIADNAIVLTKKNHIKEVDSIEEQVGFCLRCYERIKTWSWPLEVVHLLCFPAFFSKLEVGGKADSKTLKGPCSYFARETLFSSIKGQEIKLKGSSSVIKDGL